LEQSIVEQLSQLFIETVREENDWDNRATLRRLHCRDRPEALATSQRPSGRAVITECDALTQMNSAFERAMTTGGGFGSHSLSPF
jgi:hypothetical protein